MGRSPLGDEHANAVSCTDDPLRFDACTLQSALQDGHRPSEVGPYSQSDMCSRQKSFEQQSILQGIAATSPQMPQSLNATSRRCGLFFSFSEKDDDLHVLFLIGTSAKTARPFVRHSSTSIPLSPRMAGDSAPRLREYDWPGLSGTGVRSRECGEFGSNSFFVVESLSCSGASEIMLRRNGDKEGRRMCRATREGWPHRWLVIGMREILATEQQFEVHRAWKGKKRVVPAVFFWLRV